MTQQKFISVIVAGNPEASSGFGTLIRANSPLFEIKDQTYNGVNTNPFFFTIKSGKFFVVYKLVKNNVRSHGSTRNGTLMIAISIPKGYELANGVSPYDVLIALMEKFQASNMTCKDEPAGIYEFNKEIDTTVFEEIVSQYPLAISPFRYYEMLEDGAKASMSLTSEKISELMSNVHYPEFRKYSELIVAEYVAPESTYDDVSYLPVPRSREVLLEPNSNANSSTPQPSTISPYGDKETPSGNYRYPLGLSPKENSPKNINHGSMPKESSKNGSPIIENNPPLPPPIKTKVGIKKIADGWNRLSKQKTQFICLALGFTLGIIVGWFLPKQPKETQMFKREAPQSNSDNGEGNKNNVEDGIPEDSISLRLKEEDLAFDDIKNFYKSVSKVKDEALKIRIIDYHNFVTKVENKEDISSFGWKNSPLEHNHAVIVSNYINSSKSKIVDTEIHSFSDMKKVAFKTINEQENDASSSSGQDNKGDTSFRDKVNY